MPTSKFWTKSKTEKQIFSCHVNEAATDQRETGSLSGSFLDRLINLLNCLTAEAVQHPAYTVKCHAS